ncbi:MAG: trypsin-like peptidase domain-containing protein [Chloroflexota bacterium]
MISGPAGYEGTREKKMFRKYVINVVVVMLLMAMTALTGCRAAEGVSTPTPGVNVINTATPVVVSLYDENTIVSLYERAIPAVVEIETVTESRTDRYGPFEFDIPEQKGQGSGFLIDDEGHILTNYHVVEDATTAKVILHNGSSLEADVLGTDRVNDLALLRVDTDKLNGVTPLPLGDSDEVKPGQMAIALGSPFGLEGSVTAGIISGVGRSLSGAAQRPITDVLQTDAAINPGNSGGPLLNAAGEVIGVNTAIEPESSGIGFAIPINTVKSLLSALKKGEEVKSAWLGINGKAVDSELVKRLKLPVDSGVYIVAVMLDSPAEKAGLVEGGSNEQGEPASGGDVITAVDGKKVNKVEDLVSYFNTKKPGDSVSLSVNRGGKDITVEVTLGEWPEKM